MPGSEKFSLKNVANVGIIGNGNVAIDVARILGSPIDRLLPTDISQETLEEISSSDIQEINIYGRRGAVQAAMTIKELRQFSKISGISVRVFQDEIDASLSSASVHEAQIGSVQVTQQQRSRKRLFDLINSFPRTHTQDARVKVNFRFLLSPVSFAPPEITLTVNQLQGEPDKQVAVSTGKNITEKCDLLIRSIGYSSVQIDPDLPFDSKNGVVKNVGGKIIGNSYVTGWARTGPFGVIDTTMRNAFVNYI